MARYDYLDLRVHRLYLERIDSQPPVQMKPQRYATVITDTPPKSSSAAMDLAMQDGRNILDGKVHGQQL
jgi:hypothetical protein